MLKSILTHIVGLAVLTWVVLGALALVGATPGHETFECLRANRDTLSPECREAARPPHHRDRPPRR